MNEYVTFKRTALLMLMFIAAWCLPVKGQDNNGYNLWSLNGNSYENSTSGGIRSSCGFAFPEDAPQTVYALFKLKDPSQTQWFDFIVDGDSLDRTKGELWINLSAQPERYFMYEIKLPGDGSKRTYAYTVSLFGEQNVSAAPLAVFNGSMITRKFAEVTLSTSSIREDLNKPVQFTVSVKANDFIDSTDVKLRINGYGTDNDAFLLETTDGTLDKSYDTYYLPIGKLAATSSYTFTVRAVKAFTGNLNLSLEMGTTYTMGISWSNPIRMSFPFTPSKTDVDGLKKIATDNPGNTELADYIKNEGWKKDFAGNLGDKIGVRWNDSVPARIRSLMLHEQKTNLQVLDVSPFTDLEDLTINNCDIKSLDVSKLSQLRGLNIWNTLLTYDKVKLPENTDKLQVSGMSTLPPPALGEPVPNNEDRYQMPAGSEVDLSAYAIQNGKKAVFSWYKSGNFAPIPIQLDSIAPGKFRMPAQMEGENVWYHCQITTAAFPQWGMQTPFIRLTRGAIIYSQDDINLLKALAKANPNCSELQEFIKAEGWKEAWAESWQDLNRKVAVDWDFSSPARISKLRVENVDTIVSLDISGFTEVAYLYCSNLKLKNLDLSKNTKLEQIMVYGNSLASLDVSKCVNMNYLDCDGQRDTNYKAVLISLNIKGCTKLQTLDIQNNSELDVDLSDAKDLRTLRINNTTKLARYVTNPPASLERLYYNQTDYPELDLAKHPNIIGYGVPRSVTELDLTSTNIRELGVSGSGLKYSTLKVKEGTSVDGGTQIPVSGLNKNEYGDYYEIQNGDTIDLSSEAMIDGKASVYTWVDNNSRTEVTDLFLPVKDKPGVFVANGKLDKWYFCIIANEKYCRESEINRFSGWRMETYQMHIQTPPAAYDDTEVAALKAIVDGSTSITLKECWESTWQGGFYSKDGRIMASWNLDEETNTYHLNHLRLSYLRDSLTSMDVSKFKELEYLDCPGNSLTSLSVKENSKLKNLDCSSSEGLTSLILPDNKVSLRSLTCNENPKLLSLDVVGYSNLEMLSVRNNTFTTLNLSQNAGLLYLWCNGTPIEGLDISKCEKLQMYGVPSTVSSFDMNTTGDSLKVLDPSLSKLKFSTVTLKNGQPWSGNNNYWTEFSIDGIRKPLADYHLLKSSDWVDLSSEMMINGQASTVKKSEYMPEWSSLTVEVKDGKVRFNGQPREQFSVVVENPVFPNWKMELYGEIYTCDGDANLDNKVNVQDIAATASYILKDKTSMLPMEMFGYYQADVNYDNQWNVADIVGIANIILDKQVTKSNPLRSSFIPTVELTAEDGFLCMNTPVAIAGVQLEFTGLTETEGLLGKAATFTQASCLGDTSRILGYSLKGESIPAGKSILMKLPAGARLVKAAFSDEKAQSLSVETRGDLATSNEIVAVTELLQVSNYPNPFRSTTTLVYSLTENVDNAIIQVYATNGRLVHTINGLSVQAGENQYTYTTTLVPGTYFYRLVTQKQGVDTYSKSNTFIIK